MKNTLALYLSEGCRRWSISSSSSSSAEQMPAVLSLVMSWVSVALEQGTPVPGFLCRVPSPFWHNSLCNESVKFSGRYFIPNASGGREDSSHSLWINYQLPGNVRHEQDELENKGTEDHSLQLILIGFLGSGAAKHHSFVDKASNIIQGTKPILLSMSLRHAFPGKLWHSQQSLPLEGKGWTGSSSAGRGENRNENYPTYLLLVPNYLLNLCKKETASL